MNFKAKGMRYFKTQVKFPDICPAVGQTERILTSTVG